MVNKAVPFFYIVEMNLFKGVPLENTLPAPLEISQYFMSKAQGQSKISSEKQRLLASFNDQVAGEQRALTFFAARKKNG